MKTAGNAVDGAVWNVPRTGAVVTFNYLVTNKGQTYLANVKVVDDNGTAANTSDDFTVCTINTVMAPGSSSSCSKNVFVVVGDGQGEYRNVATVTGNPTDSGGNDLPGKSDVTDTDDAVVESGGGAQGTPTVVPSIYRLYLPLLVVPAQPTPTPTPTPTEDGPGPVGTPTVIPNLYHPKGLAVHSGSNILYIASRDNDRLLKVNGNNLAVLAEAETGAEPWGVVVNQNTNRVYVSNYGSGDVWVYDATTMAVLKKIHVGGELAMMTILPDLDTVAVVIRSSNGVGIIQGTRLVQVVGTGGVGPYGITADVVNKRIFVTNRDGGNMQEIYLNEFGTWLTEGQKFSFSDRRIPFGVVYNSNNQKLYMVYVINNDWYVDVWKRNSQGTLLFLATIPVQSGGGAGDPNVGGSGLEVDLATNNVFNINTAARTVSVISGSTNTVVATEPTSVDPFTIAINPVTRKVYVGLRSTGSIQVFADNY